MIFEPQFLGKEKSVGILKESSLEEIDLKALRSRLWDEIRSINSWQVPTPCFEKLLEQVSPHSLGLFFPKTDWAEPSNLENLKTPATMTPLYPHMSEAQSLSFHRLEEKHVEEKLGVRHLSSPLQAQVPELLLLPALACDLQGRRIGRGGGFYDRYLSTHKVISCAVLHSQFVFKNLKNDYFHENDQRVNFILTENELIEIKKEVSS
jgi:5-formyltetrahydrofolate cyclo-ligase